MAKKKQEKAIIFNCQDCINSIIVNSLNCRLKMQDNKEKESSIVNTVENCIWFKIKKDKNEA